MPRARERLMRDWQRGQGRLAAEYRTDFMLSREPIFRLVGWRRYFLGGGLLLKFCAAGFRRGRIRVRSLPIEGPWDWVKEVISVNRHFSQPSSDRASLPIS